jgi:glycogen debranching enzyme
MSNNPFEFVKHSDSLVETADLFSLYPVLHRVISPSGMIYASDSFHFQDAFFGRDALEVAEDLLDISPQVAFHVVLALAALQGTTVHRKSEEEPGKIHHEYRNLLIDGHTISASSQTILQQLSVRWGGTATEVLYYGTIDATPLYVRLIARYCRRYGRDLLDASYVRKDGQKATIRESVHSALEWIVEKITASDLHLLEFLHMSEEGHLFQDWKDGNRYAHLHRSGEMLNTSAPIASIAVQGLAYDALVEAAQLFHSEQPGQAHRCSEVAQHLQEAVLQSFWMPEERFLAMAIDRDALGRPRQVQTITSDPGTLLATGLFDGLADAEKKAYVAAIAQRIVSPELLTDIGVRCRSLLHKDLVPFADSQGAWAVWPKETYDITKGFWRQGFSSLAEQLEVRILNAVAVSGSYAEFFYVHPDGRVCYDPRGNHTDEQQDTICCMGLPEETQAWTISAVIAIKQGRKSHYHLQNTHHAWQKRCEEEWLSQVPSVARLKTPEAILSVYARSHTLRCVVGVQED